MSVFSLVNRKASLSYVSPAGKDGSLHPLSCFTEHEKVRRLLYCLFPRTIELQCSSMLMVDKTKVASLMRMKYLLRMYNISIIILVTYYTEFSKKKKEIFHHGIFILLGEHRG